MGFEYQSLAAGDFQMPDGWKLTTIQEIAEVNEKAITKRNAPLHIEYIDIASVDKGWLLNVQELPFGKAPSRARRVVRNKDSLIATVRPNLEHYLFVKEAKPNTIASTGFAVVSARTADPRFLYYYMTSKPFTAYLTQIAESHTSTYPAFNPDVIENAELILPPDDEQHAIAHILGSLDDKIELNRRMNETLEAMARAIFKSWFVDFDPVRAKAEGRDPGVPNEIAALFPDSFQASDLGEIPKGWKAGVVSDLGEVICGKTPPTKDPENYGGEIPFITIPDMHGKVFVTQTGKYLSTKGANTQSKKFLPPKSICVSCIATPGLVILTSEKSQTNQQINSVIPENSFSPFYCFQLLRRLGDQIRAGGSGGSVLLNLNKTQFSNIEILLAEQRTIEAYHNIVEPLFDRLFSNERESYTLASLRDTLLPKLISGELRVPDAEKFVEEAGV